MKTNSNVLVVGAAHLVISAGPSHGAQNEGMSIDIGGHGAELASSVAFHGGRARLLSAFPDSPFTHLVEEALRSSGVTVLSEYTTEFMGVPGQVSISHEQTQTQFQASAMNVHQFSEGTIMTAFQNVGVVLLDPEMHPYTMAFCLEMAAEKQAQAILVDFDGRIVLHDMGREARNLLVITSPLGKKNIQSSYRAAVKACNHQGWETPCRWVVIDGYDIAVHEDNDEATFKSFLVPENCDTETYGIAFASLLAIELAAHKPLGLHAALLASMDSIFALPKMSQKLPMMSALADSAIDSITGLPNRKFAETKIAALAKGQPLAFVFVDLDHFKSVNDNFGHDMGDVILRSAASTMKNALRAGDIGVRWGGEEFLCVLRNTDLDEAAMVAERIREAIETSVAKPDGSFVTASLGVSYMEDGNWRQSVASADEALYRAKRGGRNRVEVAGSMQHVAALVA